MTSEEELMFELFGRIVTPKELEKYLNEHEIISNKENEYYSSFTY